jgi:hypothetical protein
MLAFSASMVAKQPSQWDGTACAKAVSNRVRLARAAVTIACGALA